ncbi:MAG TPA: hypothetical protein VMV98_04495 [Acidobacteriaceae bacterium]|nr:hypothetical protein [Acidobacteriaceae bacterium]
MSATAEVSVESPASSQLAAELWISFASLLRSHVAMHSIAAPSHSLRLHSSKEARLDVLGPFGKLSIVGPNATGVGATEFRPENGERGDEYATFFFTEDGLVQLEGLESPLEVEAAVEYLLRKVQA